MKEKKVKQKERLLMKIDENDADGWKLGSFNEGQTAKNVSEEETREV